MSNAREYKASMNKISSQLLEDIKNNMEDACLECVRYAKQECPVDQGLLRGSINYATQREGNTIKGYVGSNLEYAPYVHQGTGIYAVDGDGRKTPWKYEVKAGKYKGFHITRGQRPNPFLERAVLKVRKKFPSIIAKGVK